MQIQDKIAVVTGAAAGIGRAVAEQLARRGARAVALVDRAPQVAEAAEYINREAGGEVARAFCGDVCAPDFRAEVFAAMEKGGEVVRICVPAAGILRDALAVRVNRDSGAAQLYDADVFRTVLEVNLVHPVYWAVQMLARIAEARAAAGLKKWRPDQAIQGVSVLIGSVSSRGNRGQISYACAKSGLNAAAKTLNAEGMFYGVQSKIVHPGMVNTAMLEQLPDGHFDAHFKPQIPLGRLIEPAEIAEAVAVLIENPAISGPLWADAGLAPMA
ncbi:MAG: SDR family NAD(P)-dependent oxidoreductase [Gammaproteobacteria bacterium]|nr:SDR family NAD(P)-dependent oxidoreductase [Gammaproteobacteria bacterium]